MGLAENLAKPPQALERIFCGFELYASLISDASFDIFAVEGNPCASTTPHLQIDIRAAVCRDDDVKKEILDNIEQEIGIDAANEQCILTMRRAWALAWCRLLRFLAISVLTATAAVLGFLVILHNILVPFSKTGHDLDNVDATDNAMFQMGAALVFCFICPGTNWPQNAGPRPHNCTFPFP